MKECCKEAFENRDLPAQKKASLLGRFVQKLFPFLLSKKNRTIDGKTIH